MIENYNFLSCRDMPYMSSSNEVYNWLSESDIMRYIFERVRKVLIFDYNTNTWRGVNYGKPERELLSKKKKIRANNKRFLELLESEKLDLLRPVKSSFTPANWDEFKNGDIVKILAQNRTIIKHFFILLARQNIIIPHGKGWIGYNTLKMKV